ncbi:hypothetical protein halTADL_2170 [Halohasta litchfieldiae]|jgi:hypothetical protein|uniref:Uncharacterized protein n=1 Tax=Halohasta litchfieldiae TaxID=1073996 RepID=A0A1H6TMC3_9EURY|nr:hypothetical protein [Halohasta litchfieldiae]ATW88917.1 hypothetical protein halTADL_2170 [Halohasta litchfieldiae]SEI81141.1 hypothetical protein SAMN05444271_108131 [Halohasta litchfieldiae]
MYEPATLVLSALLSVTGLLSIPVGYRIYVAEQRSEAGRLWTLYCVLSAAECATGLFVFTWVLTRGLPSIWLFILLPLSVMPRSLIQWPMHKRMAYTPWIYRVFDTPSS